MNNDEFQITAAITFSLNREDIDAIIGGALNGNYYRWYSHADIVGKPLDESESKHFSLGGTLRFIGREGYDNYDLTLDAFLKGVHLFVENELVKEIIYGRGVDSGLTDELAANDIVEYAIFGGLLRESEE